MTDPPPWLPPLITLGDAENSWELFIGAVYAKFRHDFITSQPRYEGRWVRCRRDPIIDGKEAGFWHCASEGRDEVSRTPDLRRCERIAWVRAVLENARDPLVESWLSPRGSDRRTVLWLNEEYVVVLADRRKTWQLITAYCTFEDHQRRKLRSARDASRNG